jgi:adenylate kinase
MLRAAIAAQTPVGLKAKDIMAAGHLVPDDIVVGIISDRIDQPDAVNGFILDGFPRTEPQAEELDELLKKKRIKLDAVIELKVNESALLARVENRAAETRARGEDVRADDTPEVLTKRLHNYRAQTEPLIHYYADQRKLMTVDGMMPIEEVTTEIQRILDAIGVTESQAKSKAKSKASRNKAAPAKHSAGTKKAAKKVSKAKTAARGGKSARKAPKKTAKGARKAGRAGSSAGRGSAAKTARKGAKKLARKRAKA